MFEGVQKIDSEIYPNVPTHCFYGTTNKKKTPEKLSYKYGKWEFLKKLFKNDAIKDKKPKISYGDGDGTVNIKSLDTCVTQWRDEKDFKPKKFDSVSHSAIVSNRNVLKEIATIVEAPTCESNDLLEQLFEAMN